MMNAELNFLGIFSGVGVYARPHPGLLPQERVSNVTAPVDFSILIALILSVSLAVRRTRTELVAWLKAQRTIPPLLGERAGVRADDNCSEPAILTIDRPRSGS